MADLTRILSQASSGDESASEQLLTLLYSELRRLAKHKLAHEPPGQTLQGTALVHEAYLRLLGDQKQQQWNNRGHFFAAAAEAMRRILIDNARRKKRLKHGGALQRVEFDCALLGMSPRSDEFLAINEAVDRLAEEMPEKAELVKLRFFAGLTIDEAAEAMGVSRATAKRHWTIARAWLYDQISSNETNCEASLRLFGGS